MILEKWRFVAASSCHFSKIIAGVDVAWLPVDGAWLSLDGAWKSRLPGGSERQNLG